MSLIKFIFLFVTIPAAVWATAPFTQCEPHLPRPTNVGVFNCNSQYCIFRRDRTVSYQAQFTPRTFSSDLYVYVYIFVDGRWYTLNIGGHIFGCRFLTQGTCPIYPRQYATLSGGIVLPRNLPTGRIVSLQIRVLNQVQHDVFCFRINGFVQA